MSIGEGESDSNSAQGAPLLYLKGCHGCAVAMHMNLAISIATPQCAACAAMHSSVLWQPIGEPG